MAALAASAAHAHRLSPTGRPDSLLVMLPDVCAGAPCGRRSCRLAFAKRPWLATCSAARPSVRPGSSRHSRETEFLPHMRSSDCLLFQRVLTREPRCPRAHMHVALRRPLGGRWLSPGRRRCPCFGWPVRAQPFAFAQLAAASLCLPLRLLRLSRRPRTQPGCTGLPNLLRLAFQRQKLRLERAFATCTRAAADACQLGALGFSSHFAEGLSSGPAAATPSATSAPPPRRARAPMPPQPTADCALATAPPVATSALLASSQAWVPLASSPFLGAAFEPRRCRGAFAFRGGRGCRFRRFPAVSIRRARGQVSAVQQAGVSYRSGS